MDSFNRKSESAWPIFIWILAIIYFLTYICSMFCNTFATRPLSNHIFRYLASQLIFIIAALLVPVVFAVHTKKIAPVTSIPAVILVISGLVTVIMIIIRGHVPTASIVYNMSVFGLDFIMATLYIIQMFVKTRLALPITYTVIYAGYLMFQTLYRGYFTIQVMHHLLTPLTRILNILGFIFFLIYMLLLAVVYCSATFAVGKKTK